MEMTLNILNNELEEDTNDLCFDIFDHNMCYDEFNDACIDELNSNHKELSKLECKDYVENNVGVYLLMEKYLEEHKIQCGNFHSIVNNYILKYQEEYILNRGKYIFNKLNKEYK